MSVRYVPVQWNRAKWVYDALMLGGTLLYLWVFTQVAPQALNHERPVDPAITNARAFGTCAFVMLTIILSIGPLARLDRRFLPLLYNRRHFGVMTCVVALSHAGFVVNWYFNFSPTPKFEAVLSANAAYGQALGFPFEVFGVFALLCLLVLATTSHDFWLRFLGAPIWKSLHMLIYPAYAALVAHVALGALQSQGNRTFAVVVVIGALMVVALHLTVAWKEWHARAGVPTAAWIEVSEPHKISRGRARIIPLPDGKKAAVFRTEADELGAIGNACAHQNGPLGEGRIVDCLVTCPWHGFQYDLATGRAPAPFTEKVPTYRLELRDGALFLDPSPNAPGTSVALVPLAGGVLA